MTNEYELPPLPEDWETELLDWVSACQSAYHIDNTPGHRFGGLGSNLEENRSEIVCFVRGLIESHAAALKSQDREDAKEVIERLPRYNFGYVSDEWGMGRQLGAIRHDNGRFLRVNDVMEAIDHARRIEGEGK